ncbi:MAG: SpoIIE family protein phosphatase [Syntrophobacteraceae bacterium]
MRFGLNDLKDSNEFLNVLLENITSAVLIVDRDFRIRQFNGALQIIFGNEGGKIADELCGAALGCAFAAEENTSCGNTSQCGKCLIRNAMTSTFRTRKGVGRKKFSRKFVSGNVPVLKFLEYSTKFIRFGEQEFTLLIIDDITEREVRKLELVDKQRLLDRDLQAAAGIQRSLLPASVSVCDWMETAWEFLPCSRIGGDIFNLFPLGDGRIGCYIMDASGHGVHSALVAVSVSQLLQPLSSRLPLGSPSGVCEELDRQYPLNRFNTFFSMLYMVLDPANGTLSWCNAGHPPALLARANGELEMLGAGCPIIGLGGLLPFCEDRKKIGAGDRIFLYTDGLIERRNGEGLLLGVEGLRSLIGLLRGEPLPVLLAALIASAMEFGAGAAPADDISLLGIEIK